MLKVEIICFSPTGNTRKACEIMKKTIENKCDVVLYDITYPDKRMEFQKIQHNGDYLIVAAPVYCQSAANTFLHYLKAVNMEFNKAIVFCTYGGISCGTAVGDTIKVLRKKKIPCVAAAEIPAKHEFALAGIDGLKNTITDHYEKEITNFIIKCFEKKESTAIKLSDRFSVGGLLPQEKLTHMIASVKTDKALCINCDACINVCPSGTINSAKANKNCICCAACVGICPTGAKKLVFRSIFPVLYLKHSINKNAVKKLVPKFYID